MSFRRALLTVLVLLSAGFALAGATCESSGPSPGFPPRHQTPGN